MKLYAELWESLSVLATRIDATMVCGSDQLCASLSSGIEGAIHAMNSLFVDHQCFTSGWGVLMVDTSNAFQLLESHCNVAACSCALASLC